MTPQEIELVQQGFARVFPRKAALTAAFYDELFRAAPDLRRLFRDDLAVQREKLASSLGAIIRNLHAPEIMLDTARALARRHVDYGVRPEHYALVGAALLAALDAAAPGGLSTDERAAWARAYDALSSEMIAAAYPAHA